MGDSALGISLEQPIVVLKLELLPRFSGAEVLSDDRRLAAL
jgi:hypothetical protein